MLLPRKVSQEVMGSHGQDIETAPSQPQVSYQQGSVETNGLLLWDVSQQGKVTIEAISRVAHVEIDLVPLDGTCREWSMVVSEGEGQPCLERQREMAHARRVLPASCGPHTTGIARHAAPNKTINLLKT